MNQDQNTARTNASPQDRNEYSQITANDDHIQTICYQCDTKIDKNNSFDFQCDDKIHSYHKDCLTRLIFSQINVKESQFIKCRCGSKFHSSVIRHPRLNIETEQQNQLLNKYFNFQLNLLKLSSKHQYKNYYTNFRKQCIESKQQIDYIISFEQIKVERELENKLQ